MTHPASHHNISHIFCFSPPPPSNILISDHQNDSIVEYYHRLSSQDLGLILQPWLQEPTLLLVLPSSPTILPHLAYGSCPSLQPCLVELCPNPHNQASPRDKGKSLNKPMARRAGRWVRNDKRIWGRVRVIVLQKCRKPLVWNAPANTVGYDMVYYGESVRLVSRRYHFREKKWLLLEIFR